MADAITPGNGWSEYQRLVLAELERHDRGMENVKDTVAELTKCLVRLESKLEENNKKTEEILKSLQEINKKTEKQEDELVSLKVKVGIWASIIGAVAYAVINSIAKTFFHL